MTAIYITFGVQYAREPHPRLPFVHPDGYLTVEAPDYRTALAVAFAMTGGAHAFDYPERPSHTTFPRGELCRVIVADPLPEAVGGGVE
jgi:hypothetical protein